MSEIEDRIDEVNKNKMRNSPTIENLKQSLEINKIDIMDRLISIMGNEEYQRCINYSDLANILLNLHIGDEGWYGEYILTDEIKDEMDSIVEVLGLVVVKHRDNNFIEVGTKRYFENKLKDRNADWNLNRLEVANYSKEEGKKRLLMLLAIIIGFGISYLTHL